MQAVLAGEDEPDAGSVADSTLTVVLDDALREAREDLAELDGLGEELSRVPEDAPGRVLGTAGHDRTLGSSPAGSAVGRRWPRCSCGRPSALLVDEPTGHLPTPLCVELGGRARPGYRRRTWGGVRVLVTVLALHGRHPSKW